MIEKMELDTKGSIKRNRLFPVFKTKVFCGKLNCVGGLISIHIDGQAFRLGVVCGFYFDRNQVSAALDNEIDLGAAFGFPIIGSIAIESTI